MNGVDIPADPHRELRLALSAHLLEGDAAGAFHFVNDLMSRGIPFDDVLFDLLAPAEADFGRRWQYGDYAIAQEHAATGATETLLALLAGSFDQPQDGDLVVVACAEGDDHSLPARMVAAYLVYLGRRVIYLGTSVPADDLAEYLAVEQPTALVLSCALVTHLPGAHASIVAAHQADVPVLAGGRGFGPDGRWAFAVGADAWAANPKEVDVILATLRPDTASGELPADLVARAAELEGHREKVLAAAVPGLGDAADSRRMRQELALLFEAVVAGLIVDDAAVVAEISGWQDTMLAAQGFGEHRGRSLATALHAALADDYPQAADLLAVADGPA